MSESLYTYDPVVSSTTGPSGYGESDVYAQYPSASPDYVQAAISDAQQYGVPVGLFLQQIGIESSWNPAAPGGGLSQITQATAANPGFGLEPLNTSDPLSQLSSAAQYDAALYNETGSWGGALAAYNEGIGAYNAGEMNVSPAYANLISQAGGQYGAGVTGSGGPLAGGQASVYQATYSGSGTAANGAGGSWNPITSLENWVASGVVEVVAIVAGIVLLAAGLFALAGGKPRDLAVLAE